MLEVADRNDMMDINEKLYLLQSKHNELVELFKVNTEAIAKLQDELQEIPGGYRNSQDIKNLKGRIERIELKPPSSSLDDFRYTGVNQKFDLIDAHLMKLEKEQKDQRQDYHDHFVDLRNYQIKKLEECCKNTVASGKALESKMESVAIEVRESSERTRRADKFMEKLRQI